MMTVLLAYVMGVVTGGAGVTWVLAARVVLGTPKRGDES